MRIRARDVAKEMPKPDLRGLYNFAGFQAVGADAQPFGSAFYHRAHRAQVHVPAPLAYIMGVADLISKLRPFAADFAYSCHFG